MNDAMPHVNLSRVRLVQSLPLLALLALTLGLTGCAAKSAANSAASAGSAPSTSDRSTQLYIGTAASAPPLTYLEDGQIVGLEADLANELARRINRQPRMISLFFANLPAELRGKRIDIIMAGLTITPGREQSLAFAEPYLQTGQQLLIHSQHRDQYTSPQSLNVEGVRGGVERDSTGSAYAQRTFNRARIRTYPTVAAAAEALSKRQIDAVVHDAPTIAWLARHDRLDVLHAVPGLLTQESIAWAVHPDNTDLLAQVNAALAQMKSDGTLDRLIQKWIE